MGIGKAKLAVCGMSLCLCIPLGAQDTPKVQFEVASVKPTDQKPGMILIGTRGGPGTPDPERLTIEGMSLRMIAANAFGVQQYRISGPDWIDTERYDITAKLPPGTTKEQAQVMMQNLLAERFQLVTHREARETSLSEVTVSKGGARMKASSAKPLEPGSPEPRPAGGPPPVGKNGELVLPPMPTDRPGMRMMMSPQGMTIQAVGADMAQLARQLETQLGRPVIDKTGLTGTWDFTLKFSREGLAGGIMGLRLPPGGAPPGADVANDSDYPALTTAIQEQLRLRLDAKRGTAEFVVIDSAQKKPGDN